MKAEKFVANRSDLLNTVEEISEEEERKKKKTVKEQQWKRRHEGDKVQVSLNLSVESP